MMARYYDLNTYFRNLFGERVHKITVDAGFTCPNRDGSISTRGCIYCNARGSGTGAHAKGLSVTDQLVLAKPRVAKRFKAKKFIAYFQAFSNTYAPVDRLRALYEEAAAVEDIVGLSIGTRPDCVDEEKLTLLQEYAAHYLVWVEYGLQSIHDKTLARINRGHDFKCFADAVAATKNRGVKICAHVIIGLPGESRRHLLQTADALADLGVDGVKLHSLYVIKGTALEKLYREGRYRCIEAREYMELVIDFLERTPANVVIQRLAGEPHPHELAAPAWALDKAVTAAAIKEEMERRDSRQGSRVGRALS
ncbi:MAG: TIGR01212 family radical SAM protein [Desulfobacterales bacterium]|nr:TIGR01212 family radical SAM protein [Desulfobacterales bacterium]